MKKIIISLFVMFLGLQVNAATTTNWDSAAAQKKLNDIAYVLIKKNALPDGISIKLSEEDDANAYANINKEIYVYKGMLEQATTDDELAAVMSHEMGHIINGHCAKQTILSSAITSITNNVQTSTTAGAVGVAVAQQASTTKISRKDEFEADLTAVDLMVNAGYNPLALISVLNKICGNYIDVMSTHPSGEKRLMNIYDYTAYNYPNAVKKGYSTTSYERALKIINANLEERNLSPRKLKKVEKEQLKLKKAKIKRAKKMAKSGNGWDSSFAILNALSSEESSK